MSRPFTNVIGFDDGPLDGRGRVPLVGVVYARERLDGALVGAVDRDGNQVTDTLARLVTQSRFHSHVRCVLLMGLTFAGFDVVDLRRLHGALDRPVLVVARREPDLERMLAAIDPLPDAARRRSCLQAAGPMEPCAGVWIQRAGLSRRQAEATLRLHTRYGALPEPLRVAHMLAAAIATGHSHGRA